MRTRINLPAVRMLAPEIQTVEKDEAENIPPETKLMTEKMNHFRPFSVKDARRRSAVCPICGVYLSRNLIGIRSHYTVHIRENAATIADREKFLVENKIWRSR